MFISYSAEDAAWVEQLRRVLKRSGVEPVSDPSTGKAWESRLRRELDRSDAVVFVLDRASRRSPWMHFEYGAAVAGGKRILPITPHRLSLAEIPEPFQRARILDERAAEDAGAHIAQVLMVQSEGEPAPDRAGDAPRSALPSAHVPRRRPRTR